jgi:hypothetical protein
MRSIGETKIYHWNEIQGLFQGADIFLGNGFSININSALNYHSLFERFLLYLTPSEKLIFKKFNSTNFEEIQNRLSNAVEVNAAFGIKGDQLETGLKQLKSGLLSAIKDLHPAYRQTDPNTIFQLSQKLDWFEDIFTANYDIFLYHITLITQDRFRRNNAVKRYQDFFRRDAEDLHFEDEPIAEFKNIYYLHGALFLLKEGERILKIKRGRKGEELLDLIRLQIHIGYLPVFVSEGKARLKEETISKSRYLSFCRSAFRSNRNRLVIHGFSFSSYDDHLINDLNDNKRKLAIGLHLQGLDDGQILQKVKTIEKKLFKYRTSEIKYFDSRTLF